MKFNYVWLIVGAFVLTAIGGGYAVDMSGKLSVSQLLQLAANAGFAGQDLLTAVAIAMAESSGNPNAHGDTSLGTGRGSFGLWQIYSDAHPEFGPDFTTLFDPQTNANAAYSVYHAARNTFKPWSTFNNGAYLANLSKISAETADA